VPPNEALQPTSVAELGRSAYVRLLVEDGHDDKDDAYEGDLDKLFAQL